MSTARSTQSQNPGATAGRSTNAGRQDNFSAIAASILDRQVEEPDTDVEVEDQPQDDPQDNQEVETGNKPVVKKKTVETETEEETEQTEEAASDDTTDEITEPAAEETPAAETEEQPEQDYQEFEDFLKPKDQQAAGDKNKGPQADEIPANAELAELLADPYIGELIKAKRKGINPYTVARQFQAVDFNSLTPEEIIRMDCQRLNITNAKEIEAEIEAHENKTPRERKAELIKITAELSAEQKSLMEKIVTQEVDQTQRTQTLMSNFERDVRNVTKDAIGKKFYNITVDEKTAKLVENHLLNQWDLFKPDGINPYKAVSYAIYDLFLRDAMKKQYSNGEKKGKIKAAVKVAQPDPMNRSASNRNASEVDLTPESLVKGFVGGHAPVNQRSKKQ